MNAKVALIVGAGGALGAATREEFAGAGYTVVGLRRAADGAGETQTIVCDLGNPAATGRVIHDVVENYGHVDVVVCNAAHLAVAPFEELALEDFETSWRVGVGSTVAAARAVLPSMTTRRSGALIITGATASIRGAARFSAFASSKFALRGLAQSLAREYQPRGVHVAHVVLDGVLRGSPSVARFAKHEDNGLEPRHVASTFRQLAEQHASAWTHEIDLRPHGERF